AARPGQLLIPARRGNQARNEAMATPPGPPSRQRHDLAVHAGLEGPCLSRRLASVPSSVTFHSPSGPPWAIVVAFNRALPRVHPRGRNHAKTCLVVCSRCHDRLMGGGGVSFLAIDTGTGRRQEQYRRADTGGGDYISRGGAHRFSTAPRRIAAHVDNQPRRTCTHGSRTRRFVRRRA